MGFYQSNEPTNSVKALKEVVLRIRLQSHQVHSTMLQYYNNTTALKWHTKYTHTQKWTKHSEMGPLRQNPIQRIVRSVHVCALHFAQLLHPILHRTDLIIFPLTLQTIIIAMMMSIW